MTTLTGVHEFSLYRSGWSGDDVPWSDNQLWARAPYVQFPMFGGTHEITLEPCYGSAANLYRMTLMLDEACEDGWVSARVMLSVDSYTMSPVPLPLTWYTAERADWPSGLARFRESDGFHPPHFPWPKPGVRAVWTLAARRAV